VLVSTGESPGALSAKLTDIFEYYIDFMVDCRKGDRFSLIVEKFFKDGAFVRYGDILSAEYRATRKNYQAFRYENRAGDTGYYDADGKSLRGLFLKSPLNYRRISSRYNRRRYHPILKKYTPHHGIDYAADYGTPVWATAGGTVTFIGRKGALGNYIEIRHKNGYKTGYGHLSKFRKGLKKGAYLKQKQTIGYVGATGRATGPHLHYNFFNLAKGKYRPTNPAGIANRPTGKAVTKAHQVHFQHHRDRLWALLDRTTGSVVTAALAPGSNGEALVGRTAPEATGPTQ
jgi:murein DD-endopeptidase MepM/ murein hydrolase activator NlpD